jgi:EpsI family protein
LFFPICLILILQTGAFRFTKIQEKSSSAPDLHEIPDALGNWREASAQALDKDVAEYLKPDEYILRDYVDQATGSTISLFIAYFSSLQDTYGPHSPSICLPGSGWLVLSSKLSSVAVPRRKAAIPVNEYLLEKSGIRILAVYWYQNNRNVWAEEFRAKLSLLPDLIRYRRSDASLVRLITPVTEVDDKKALSSCVKFTQILFPQLLDRFAATK